MLTIQYCNSDEEIAATFKVMKQLRPSLEETTYVALIRSLQQTEGYKLVSAIDDGVCVGAAGFREKRSLFRNGDKEFYVDDLVTDTQRRSQGLGHALMRWMAAETKRLGCIGIVLDSGLTRTDAHRFYRREGMAETALHFYRPPSPSRPYC